MDYKGKVVTLTKDFEMLSEEDTDSDAETVKPLLEENVQKEIVEKDACIKIK